MGSAVKALGNAAVEERVELQDEVAVRLTYTALRTRSKWTLTLRGLGRVREGLGCIPPHTALELTT